jgi:DNA-binding NtrC family response regulator
MMTVLVIEDGFEYSETLSRFLPDGFHWIRVGSGPQALAWLAENQASAVFLDMRFDRTPRDELFGDVEATADRFNGDPIQARRFLEDHQGTFILKALREAGHPHRVVVSHDFSDQPRRWAKLANRYAPIDYLPDNAPPSEIASRLRA